MIWPDHSREFPPGSHALFSPSQYAWMNDRTEEDIIKRMRAAVAARIGTEVHEEACECIKSKTRYTRKEAVKVITKRLVLADISKRLFDPEFIAASFVPFVNDALTYGMQPEQALYHSRWCAGTADAIQFDERKKLLRIHDLKTGITPAKFDQLRGYAALFFLEHGTRLGVSPEMTQMELRIYQGGEVLEEYPTAEDINPIIESIIWHNEMVQGIRKD